MSGPSQVKDVAIPLLEDGGRHALVDYLASGARAEADWKIGTEHEKFGFRTDDLRPPTFDGERGIEAVLKGLTQFGWAPVVERQGAGPVRGQGVGVGEGPPPGR